MKYKNIIVIPPYYEGTSFQDIVESLKEASKKISLPIKFIGYDSPLKNNFNDEFLDDKKYVIGQSLLLKKIINIGPVSKILFLDFFNPGIDLIKYFHEQQKYNCKYSVLLHGGSFLKHDLYPFGWIKHFELGWFEIYDIVYTPSNFLATALPRKLQEKTKVFPWGLDNFMEQKYKNAKTIDVIFPHRINSDKGIEDLINIISKMPDVKFVITSPQNKNAFRKNCYYKSINNYKNAVFLFGQSEKEHIKTLSKAKVVLSCAKQENFGYAVMKAVLSGCIPVLPNRLCYPEFFDDAFLYNNVKGAVDKIYSYLNQDMNKIEQKMIINKKKIRLFSFSNLLKDFFCK